MSISLKKADRRSAFTGWHHFIYRQMPPLPVGARFGPGGRLRLDASGVPLGVAWLDQHQRPLTDFV